MASRRKPSIAELRTVAKYVRGLKAYLVDPGPDFIDDKIDSLVKERERAQRFVYDNTYHLDSHLRHNILKLMHQPRATTPKVVPKRVKKVKVSPMPTWTPEQSRALREWRKMGPLYQQQ